ncbi:lysozyme inhibitor LprI family protein [Thiofilum flexile]|uniref:lysozyme inhibitor LprI family protein n=1 Tax=Thiofilum flexile TaxID=125627 RepID=UPI00036336F2|nr:lysozyme inhibitor LprI family protein [Thiofilum flexile]
MKQNQRLKWVLVGVLYFPVAYATTTPLPNEYCEWLYNQALESCKTVKTTNPDCVKPQTQLPSTIMQALFAFSNHPSYQGAAFEASCLASCQSNTKPTYNTFAVSVCSHVPSETNPTPTTHPAATSATPAPASLHADIAACGIENNEACLNDVLRPAKKQLNQTYQALAATYDGLANKQLDSEQRAWLDQRNVQCGKLETTTPAANAPAITQCVLQAIQQRTQHLEQALKQAKHTADATNAVTTGQWYRSSAKPVLVVREKPDISGKKLGTVPEGGKVQVLEAKIKADSISGFKGHWVKITWLNGSAYVFDAFLKPLE